MAKKPTEQETVKIIPPISQFEQEVAEAGSFVNSLGQLANLFQFDSPFSRAPTINNVNTIQFNLRWYFISNLRQLLSQAYIEHGIIQTLIDQPVDDAFRTGIEIKTSQLSPDEIEQLQHYIEKERVIDTIMQGCKWARLFGGGGVILITEQDPATPLQIDRIKENTRMEFRDFDMWELYSDGVELQGEPEIKELPDHYMYYGHKVHKSRVFAIKGKKCPSFMRPRLRGWGMSEVERLVRSLNQYIKNQDLIFELLDEAKVDVYRMKGFNSSLLSNEGTRKTAERIQHANSLKNFNNALTMDIDDEYEQKQITFTGLAEMLVQVRIGIASDVKMPVTKLFGISAAGFNSGEDDIENYNAMIEGEVRSKVKFVVVNILEICCQKLFGIVPDDLKAGFKPLRILGADEEETVKEKQFARVTQAYTLGLATAQEAKININKDALLGTELDESTDALDPLQLGQPTGQGNGGEAQEKPGGKPQGKLSKLANKITSKIKPKKGVK